MATNPDKLPGRESEKGLMLPRTSNGRRYEKPSGSQHPNQSDMSNRGGSLPTLLISILSCNNPRR